MTNHDYRETWGYNRMQALVCKDTSEKMAAQVRRRIDAGEIELHPPEPGIRRPRGYRHRSQSQSIDPATALTREFPDVTPDAVRLAAAAGLTVTQIGKRLHCSNALVEKLLQELRLHVPKGREDITVEDMVRACREGLTFPQMMKRFQCGAGLILDRLSHTDVKTPGALRRAHRLGITPEAVAAAHSAGESTAQIAERFGCAPYLVLRRLHEAGIFQRREVDPLEVARLHSAGLSQVAIAKQLGCSPPRVAALLRKAGISTKSRQTRTDITVERILALRAEGLTMERIASDLQCDIRSLVNRLRQGNPSP